MIGTKSALKEICKRMFYIFAILSKGLIIPPISLLYKLFKKKNHKALAHKTEEHNKNN